MEPDVSEPIPAGCVQPRDQPALFRSYPTELTASFPAVLRRHPGLDLPPAHSGDKCAHQGRRGPPPGWVATDISGRLYTATAGGCAYMDIGGPEVELPAPVARCPEAEEPATSRVAEGTHSNAPETIKQTTAQQSEPITRAGTTKTCRRSDRAGLPSDLRRIAPAGWSKSSRTELQSQQQTFQPTGIRHGYLANKKNQKRRRHSGFFMSPSGYCHTRGAIYKLEVPLDQDCWTCCGQTNKNAPGCVGGGAGNTTVLQHHYAGVHKRKDHVQ